jgi:antirestriction protein ArdC
MKELAAELGSTFLCTDLELTPVIRDDHAAYIDSWIKAPKNDKRTIFTAASHAQRVTDYLCGKASGGKPDRGGRVMARQMS